MSLSTTRKQSHQKSKKTAANTPEARFEREWQKVQNLQQQNQRLEQDLDELVKKVLADIEPAERAYNDELFFQTERLLGFLPKKSLTLWQREELYHWIIENFAHLQQHPFASHLDLEQLAQAIKEAAIADPHLPTGDPNESLDEHDEFEPGSQMDSEQDDLFDYDEDEAVDREFFEQLFEEFQSSQEEQREADSQQAKALNQLLKSSSINKIFRQIAKVLHPDRELDPEQKKVKHQMMSQLIEAREQGDVPTIFALYAEHVGQSPLAMIDGDLDKVTSLLKKQNGKLRLEKEAIIERDPIKAAIYERFYAKTPKGISTKIRNHLHGLNAATQEQQAISNDLNSLRNLKPYLEDRYDMRQMVSFERHIIGRRYDDEDDIPF